MTQGRHQLHDGLGIRECSDLLDVDPGIAVAHVVIGISIAFEVCESEARAIGKPPSAPGVFSMSERRRDTRHQPEGRSSLASRNIAATAAGVRFVRGVQFVDLGPSGPSS